MIKASAKKRILDEEIGIILLEKLLPYGYKYSKQKKQFYKTNGVFKQIISLSNEPEIVFNEETNETFLTFNMGAVIEIPKFDKWFTSKTNKYSHFSVSFKSISCIKKIGLDIFSSDDFYNPTASQIFKGRVISELSNREIKYIDFQKIYDNIELEFVNVLDKYSDYHKIIGKKNNPHLMFYAGFEEDAKKEYLRIYNNFIEEARKERDENTTPRYYDYLKEHIYLVDKIANIKLQDPFDLDINLTTTKNESIEISDAYKFKETQRFIHDINDKFSYYINSKGEIFFIKKSSKIYKYDKFGNLLFKHKFEKHSWGFYAKNEGVIKGTNDFYINNYVIKEDNSMIKLSLDEIINNSKAKYQNPDISDISFINNKYYLLYNNGNYAYLLIYNKLGEYQNKIIYNYSKKQSSQKIIPDRELVLIKEGKLLNLYDFKGNLVCGYKSFDFKNIRISNTTKYFLSVSYNLKSQLCDIENKKTINIKAHPTHLTNYKELICEGEAEENFCIGATKFSPNDDYLVGGAFHGKYVVWELPKAKRIELFPKPEVLEHFTFQHQKTRTFLDGRPAIIIKKTFKPEILIIDGVKTLKNRRNHITNIYFLGKGELFLTQINNSVLVWDRKNYENINFLKDIGELIVHSENLISLKKENEIIFMKRLQ